MNARRSLFISLMIASLLLSSFTVFAQESCGETDADGYLSRGIENYNNEDYAAAVADLTCALDLEVEDAQSAYFYRGTSYNELYEFNSAETDLTQALELNPEDTASMNNLANVYYMRGQYYKAIDLYTQAIEGDNAFPEVPYYNRGNANFQIGLYDESLADLNASIEANVDYTYPYLLLGIVYQTLGDSSAYGYYQQWLELNQVDRTEGELEIGVAQDLEMREGLVHALTFEAEAGQPIFVSATTTDDLDPLLVVLDPDGNPVAGDDDSGINLDSVIRDVPAPATGTYTVLLGQAGWVGTGEATIVLSVGTTTTTAASFSVYNLLVGHPARVFTTEGDNLNLREGPGLTFEVLDKLASNSTVTLLEGPRKADGYAWWRVETSDGISGWAVERVETEQTLQPALVVGGEALVFTNSGDKLNVRTAAGRSNELVTQLDNGAVVTVLEGPVELEDFVWWKIRTADGLEGWAVDRVSDEQTLVGKPNVDE